MYRRFKGTSRVIELLLSNGANINDKNSAGSTPLHILVGRKELWRFTTEGLSSDGKESISSLLKLVLRKGALINAQDNKGKTPLHLAVEAQDDEAILVLLSNNCNTSLVNEGNQTPLELAKTLHQCNTVIMAMLENPDAFVKPAEKVEVEVGVEVGVEGTNQV
jgi:ankyrin repeat protein